MKILVISDPHIPIPPRQYGGAERIVALLCRGLKDRGHDVRLIGGVGSMDYGDGVLTHVAPTLAHPSRAFRKILFQLLSLWGARGIDVVVNFGRQDYLLTLLQTGIPVVSVHQNPFGQHELDWFLRWKRGPLRFIGISQAQVAGLVPSGLIDVVYNATDTDSITPPPAETPREYLAFLGRITESKGADTAINVARRTGLPLKLAGTIMNGETGAAKFFDEKIRPHLDEQIQFVGPVDDEGKRKLLGGAKALLFPIRWAEPFGIVMAEALACGTPVVGARRASVPEVVEHGRTGFVVDSEDEMVEAALRVDTLSRSDCRRAAEERFSPRTLVDGYLETIATLRDA
jgi:glycosyltransferase involved in cell wall biosynthesis